METRPPVVAAAGQRGLDQHTANFIDCMKTRRQPVCNAEVGSLAAVNAHLGQHRVPHRRQGALGTART